ncbi:Enriched in surface-labeled proteome protein 18 [Novymonas esmeraldas]|uniref:Enriched in surface-labeled proteome protein 18 n=1 Tax=Novymonas esmeraldas TaxID=1808958 RepID=A0AAW0ERQ8_9TRYP
MTPTATAVAAVPVTLQEACRTEMRVHCGDHAASPLRCLLEHYDRTATTNHHGGSPRQQSAALYSGVCASWLVARATCLGFVHKHAGGLCGSAVRDARECLRQIPPVALPPTCVMSDYYGSVQLIGKLRQHQSADLRAA